MGLRGQRDDDFVARESLVLEETVRRAKRLYEYTKYGLVILDCLFRKSEAQGFRSLNDTRDLRSFIEQLQFVKNLAQAAPLRKCFFNQNGNVTRLNDLHTLISRQMGLLLVRPVVLRSRGYYHPSPSACQLSFRYGAETYVFRGEDFENLTNKMIELDINLMPQDVSLRIQQGYFKTAVFPLESFRLSTKLHRSSCPKIDPDKHVNELELKFAIDCQGNASEVVIKLEVQWLYVRRPMFLGNLDQWRNHSTEHIEQQHSEAKHVLRVSES